MKNFKFLPIVFSICLALTVFAAVPAMAVTPPEITSRVGIVLDQDTGEILYAKDVDERIYPADTAKIMTALLAVEAIETGEVTLHSEVTITEDMREDLGDSGSSLLNAGEALTLESLLYYALLPSADDACNAIAVCVGGNIYTFVDMMNDRAVKLGCTGTHFTNTHGLYDEYNYSTARDMGLIAMEAARHDIFMRFCGAATADVPETNISPARTLRNTNALINGDSVYGSGYLYDRATGIKSGSNTIAGYCLVSAASDEESGINLIAAVFGGVKDAADYTSFTDSILLCDWVFQNYSYQEVVNPDNNIASVDVNLGKDSDYVNLRPSSAVTLLLPNDYDPAQFELDLVVYSIQQGEIVTAPVTAGEVLGEVSVLRDGQNCGTVKLVAATSVDLSRTQYIRSNIEETVHTGTFRLIFGLTLGILILYVAWVIFYRVRRIQYKRAMAAEQPMTEKRGSGKRPLLKRPTHTAGKNQAQKSLQKPNPSAATPQAVRQQSPVPAGGQQSRQPAQQSGQNSPSQSQQPVLQGAQQAGQQTPQQPSAESKPPSWNTVADDLADAEINLFGDPLDKDYFEEFFRKK